MSTVEETGARIPGAKAGPEPDAKDDLKSLPVPEVEKRLSSSPDGLSQAAAEKRLTRYGPYEIEEKKENPLLKLLTYFWGPIPWMIEAAVILPGVLRHWPDFFIILLLLVANAMVGFWEEHQAGKAIDALKAQLAVKCRVRRDGTWVTPPSRELAPGDVIRMRMGDIVPADARLLAGDPVEVDQSALTGESLPVTAAPGDAVYSGSIIKQGEIGALVYATGTGTYFGKTAELVQDARTVSHFQRAVLKIGKFLIILAVALVAVITVVSIVRGNPVLDTLQFALVLTVAAIPVAMPTVLSVTMAAGARLLAKKKAIVSLLVAIEELAGVDVLCSDKTGTLTQNKLTLGDPFTVGKVTARPGRHQARGDAGGGGVHRGGRRVRPGVPRAQVPHRGRAAEAGPHRRHDRRRGERRPRAEESRLRHRRVRCHRRGARRGVHRADEARPVGDHRRGQGEP